MMDPRGAMMAGRLMQGAPTGTAGGMGGAGFAGLPTGIQSAAPLPMATNAAPAPLATFGGPGGFDAAALQAHMAAGPQHLGGFSAPAPVLQNNDILPSQQGIAAPFASTIKRPGTWVGG